MKKRDKPSLMALVRNTPEFKPAEVTVAEEVIDSYLRDPAGSGYNVLVAGDSAVNGYICYGPAPLTEGTWDVYWIAVAPEEKGRGTGSALLAYAEDKIKEAKGRLIIIETSSQAGYERTRRFYQKHAYEVIAQITDFYAPGDDKIILQKRLR
jgi:ribosomal protein S18 acetylase RimI-like enzyme